MNSQASSLFLSGLLPSACFAILITLILISGSASFFCHHSDRSKFYHARSKKFPISIKHPERILFSNSRELLLYCATGFEKESWCNSLRHAARLHAPEKSPALKMREDYATFIDLMRQMAEGGEEWLASDPHGKETGNTSSIGKWRAKLKKRSKGRFASWGSAEEAAAGGGVLSPGARPPSPPRKGESDNEDSPKREGQESGTKSGPSSRVRSLLGGRKLNFRKKKEGPPDVGERSRGSSMGDSVLSEDEVSDTGGLLSGDEFSGGEDSGRKGSIAGDVLSTGGGEEGKRVGSREESLFSSPCLLVVINALTSRLQLWSSLF